MCVWRTDNSILNEMVNIKKRGIVEYGHRSQWSTQLSLNSVKLLCRLEIWEFTVVHLTTPKPCEVLFWSSSMRICFVIMLLNKYYNAGGFEFMISAIDVFVYVCVCLCVSLCVCVVLSLNSQDWDTGMYPHTHTHTSSRCRVNYSRIINRHILAAPAPWAWWPVLGPRDAKNNHGCQCEAGMPRTALPAATSLPSELARDTRAAPVALCVCVCVCVFHTHRAFTYTQNQTHSGHTLTHTWPVCMWVWHVGRELCVVDCFPSGNSKTITAHMGLPWTVLGLDGLAGILPHYLSYWYLK